MKCLNNDLTFQEAAQHWSATGETLWSRESTQKRNSSETGVITPGFNVRPLEQVVSKTVRQSARIEHRDINEKKEQETQGNNTRTG